MGNVTINTRESWWKKGPKREEKKRNLGVKKPVLKCNRNPKKPELFPQFSP